MCLIILEFNLFVLYYSLLEIQTMVSSLSAYSTFLDLSSTSDLPDDLSPSNTVLRSQSLHGKKIPGNASGEYANLGLTGSLEDFQNFTNGYNCTSSRFGSLETVLPSAKKDIDHSQTNQMASDNIWSFPGEKRSSLFFEIENALQERHGGSQVESEEDGVTCLIVHVIIPPMEQRFGFSVSGGSDESFPPRVDNISPGLYQSLLADVFSNYCIAKCLLWFIGVH